MKTIERRLPLIMIGVGILLLVGVIAQVIMSLPPRHFVFLTGREGGAYYAAAQRYQAVAARNGFTIELVQTAGSVEALRRLEAGEGDVAFVQGGIAAQGDTDVVSSLAAVAYEPVWIFYRRELAPDAPLDSLTSLQDLRIGIGEQDSGTNQLARLLLADFQVTEENATFEESSLADAKEALASGQLDAVIAVSNFIAPTIRELTADRRFELMNVAQAEALSRRHQFLSVLSFPQGTIDLVDLWPRNDVTMVSTTANLVVRNDLHPDLLRLLAYTAVEIHGVGGFFQYPNEFPDTENTDLPVSKEGKTYLQRIKNGEFTLDRYLPFWAAAMFDRYLLFVVPFLLIVLPTLSRSPMLYEAYMRRKINRWYDKVRAIEVQADLMNLTEVDSAIAELERIDGLLPQEVSVSSEYMPNLYALRTHIDYVTRRLQRREQAIRTGSVQPKP